MSSSLTKPIAGVSTLDRLYYLRKLRWEEIARLATLKDQW